MFDLKGSADLVDPTINIIIIISFIWDILLSFHTSYYHKGVIVSNKKFIARTYFKKSFLGDILALLPLIIFHGTN